MKRIEPVVGRNSQTGIIKKFQYFSNILHAQRHLYPLDRLGIRVLRSSDK